LKQYKNKLNNQPLGRMIRSSRNQLNNTYGFDTKRGAEAGSGGLIVRSGDSGVDGVMVSI
jgi:hypothetical protein